MKIISEDSSNSVILIIRWCSLSQTPPKAAVVITNIWKREDWSTNVLTNAEVVPGFFVVFCLFCFVLIPEIHQSI